MDNPDEHFLETFWSTRLDRLTVVVEDDKASIDCTGEPNLSSPTLPDRLRHRRADCENEQLQERLMKTTVVRYKTKEGSTGENERLIKRVFRELETKSPDGICYAVLKLSDGTLYISCGSTQMM